MSASAKTFRFENEIFVFLYFLLDCKANNSCLVPSAAMSYFAFVQDASGKKTELQDGKNMIGRESNFLRATLGKVFTEDLRISRKHVELIFTRQTGSLVIRVVSFVFDTC